MEAELRSRFSERTVYHLMSSSNFPLPLNPGSRTSRWLRREIDEWLLTHELTKDDLGKLRDNTDEMQADAPEDKPEEQPKEDTEDKT